MASFPYADRIPVNRTMPDAGRPREEIIADLTAIATEEDASWETGRISGSLYCGDHSHYDFLTEAFGLFAHVNVLQRDLCPSATRFEGEIIAMTLDMLGASAVTDGDPVGLVTSGGTGSIAHAMLAYREQARAAGRTGRLNVVKPETAHPAFDKACHLFDLEMRVAPVSAETTVVDPADVAALVDADTVAIIGSACNYGYGTVDPITELGQVALERGVGLHVDGCLGGFILPWGRELGYDIPAFDFSVPGVTTISADTHKYGYAFKGVSTVLYRDPAMVRRQWFLYSDWPGGLYGSPTTAGTRPAAAMAGAWAAIRFLGEEGYMTKASQVMEATAGFTAGINAIDSMAVHGDPDMSVFEFGSDRYDTFAIGDVMDDRGWNLDRQPGGLHAMLFPYHRHVIDEFCSDLAEAVANHGESRGKAATYGGVAP